jgi:protein-tyrosine phosphatase
MTSSARHSPNGSRWLRLEGAVNVRDVGGLPLSEGGSTVSGRLLRSDNLQDLTASDVLMLRDRIGVTDVVDLRTWTERTLEGVAPLDLDPAVTVRHLSLLPRGGDAVREVDGNVLLPWQRAEDDARPDEVEEEIPVERAEARSVYTSYLHDRPDSIVAALSAVAHADGAVVVHCAAGKDRTGVVVALALDLVGVQRSAIIEDYLMTAHRIDAILERLRSSSTYAENLRGRERDSHLPRAEAVEGVFSLLDAAGGTDAWLGRHGWRSHDTRSLQVRLAGG